MNTCRCPSCLIEAMVKPSSLQAFAHRPALVRSKCGCENRIKNTFFIRSVLAYRELLIAAVLVVTIVQHRTSVLDKTACVCSKTSRVEHAKSVHNRPKPAVFVRTALGLSSNQNEVAINSKSGLWRTALLPDCLPVGGLGDAGSNQGEVSATVAHPKHLHINLSVMTSGDGLIGLSLSWLHKLTATVAVSETAEFD